MGDNSGIAQPSLTLTPKRCVQSRLLELEHYIHAIWRISMSITPGAKKPILPHVVYFSQAIEVCVRKIFPVRCLSPSLLQRVLNHSLGTRYARLCWIDDRTTQKALVGDPSPKPARRPVRAVPRP
ncbi:CACTA en-spm transposon protein [Cucumis melo var. makuwa]|nr:CACTA en-spm transposon protein [Cucumis melo var. makuwa]